MSASLPESHKIPEFSSASTSLTSKKFPPTPQKKFIVDKLRRAGIEEYQRCQGLPRLLPPSYQPPGFRRPPIPPSLNTLVFSFGGQAWGSAVLTPSFAPMHSDFWGAAKIRMHWGAHTLFVCFFLHRFSLGWVRKWTFLRSIGISLV